MGNRILFLDDEYIEHSENITRTFHPFEKEIGNPVFVKKYDWEGIGPYGSAVFEQDGRYVMFYVTYGGKKSDYPSGIAFSSDGINWERGDEWTSSIDDDAQCTGIMYDNGRLWKGYNYIGASFYRRSKRPDVPCMRFKRSVDGIHWEDTDIPEWTGPSDVYYMLWDDVRKKYVMYYKLWKLSGITTDGEAFCAYFPGFDYKESEGVFHAYGYSVLPERKDIDVYLKNEDTEKSQDGGGGLVCKSITMIRIIARAESADLREWTDERVIIEPADDAPLGDQTYGMSVKYENGVYIAHLSHFNAVDGHIQQQLAWSYDGINFNINNDGYLLSCGKGDDWDRGMVSLSVDSIEKDGRICAYYGATDLDHTVCDVDYKGGVGRAWLRREGYASISGGTLVTKPIRVTGKSLSFNMKGKLKISVTDENNNKICEYAVSGDNDRITPEGMDLTEYMGKEIRLELNVENCELYSAGFTA